MLTVCLSNMPLLCAFHLLSINKSSYVCADYHQRIELGADVKRIGSNKKSLAQQKVVLLKFFFIYFRHRTDTI